MTGCHNGLGGTKHSTRVVTQLKNGGILMELASDEMVTWFTDSGVRQSFLIGLHSDTTIKCRDYHTVVQFIPLTFRPKEEGSLCEIEEVNILEKGSLVWARWIKLVNRRSPKKTCRHVILSFSSPQSMNNVLANGIYVCEKKLYAGKCKKEPFQCLKCYRWGHMVHNCLKSTDTCGTCMQRHQTDTCTNITCSHCMSCGTAGHASLDWGCPVFQKSVMR